MASSDSTTTFSASAPAAAEAAHALASQVGGHAGVQTSDDGSLLIKPALPLEHKFYQELTENGDFAALRPFVPKFLGTLKLEGKVDEETGAAVMTEVEGQHKESIVLENLTFPFYHPNILDIKLGTVLYDDDASPEKVERMLKTARETTSLDTGVRLTGFQVYDQSTGEAVNTPKSYGKSIQPSDLPDGIARFFPVYNPSAPLGLPVDLLLPILHYIREDVADIRAAVASIEMRMVGGSLLVLYEGDAEKARSALEYFAEHAGADDDDEEEGDEEDEEDEESKAKKPGPPFAVKLIDFAHAKIVAGQGPDEGVLKGFDTTLSLLDGRIKQLETL